MFSSELTFLLIYKVMLISSVQKSDSVIHIYIVFHYDLSQGIEYSSLCYAVRPCCLSVPRIKVASANPKPLLSLPASPSPWQPQVRSPCL